MGAVNRIRQQTLRLIHEHVTQATLRHGADHTQTALMDVFQVQDTGFDKLNYIMPRRNVALVPLAEVEKALAVGQATHELRLSAIEGLYPPMWFEQLRTIGLRRWHGYPLLTYGAVPDCDQQPPDPPTRFSLDPTVTLHEARTPGQIEACLRLYGKPTIQDIRRSVRASQNGDEAYLVAQMNRTTIAGVLLSLVNTTLQICCVGALHQSGTDPVLAALMRAAVDFAAQRGCAITFTISETPALTQFFRQSGFTALDQVVTFRKSAHNEQSLAQSVS